MSEARSSEMTRLIGRRNAAGYEIENTHNLL